MNWIFPKVLVLAYFPIHQYLSCFASSTKKCSVNYFQHVHILIIIIVILRWLKEQGNRISQGFFIHTMRHAKLEYLVTTGKLAGEMGRGKPKEQLNG